MTDRVRAVGRVLGSGRPPHRLAVLLALGCMPPIPAASAGAAGTLRFRHVRVTLHLARPGHSSNTLGRMNIPRRLPGYYLYMRVARADGRTLPRVGQGRVLVLTGAHRRPLAQLILSSRYDPSTGRLRYAVTVKNLRVRHYRSRSARLRATVTVGYRV